MEKVFPADAYSAVGIAGAAGPAVEMVRLFQIELEYYEKVEGEALSLAGKANRLGALIRANLPAAMQGFVVLPLFGGYDPVKSEGRIYRYDVTGGLSEETDYHAIGSGGRDAKNSMKKLYAGPERHRRQPRDRDRRRVARRRRRGGRRDRRSRSRARDLPDGLGHRPGRRPAHAGRRRRDGRARGARAPDEQRGRSLSMSSPFMYASPEQIMKDRADYARRNIARGKPILGWSTPTASCSSRRTRPRRCTRSRRSTTASRSAAVGKYPEYENLRILGIRQADLKGYAYSRDDVTARSLANLYSQVLDQVFTQLAEAVRGRDPRRRRRGGRERDGDVPRHVRRRDDRRARLRGRRRTVGRAEDHLAEHYNDTPTSPQRSRWGQRHCRASGTVSSKRRSSKRPSSTGRCRAGGSAAWKGRNCSRRCR